MFNSVIEFRLSARACTLFEVNFSANVIFVAQPLSEFLRQNLQSVVHEDRIYSNLEHVPIRQLQKRREMNISKELRVVLTPHGSTARWYSNDDGRSLVPSVYVGVNLKLYLLIITYSQPLVERRFS